MIRVEYTCPDGTPFPVDFETPEQAAQRWAAEREHMAEPSPPLSVGLSRLGVPGGDRAYEEAGMTMPAFFVPGPAPFGFWYYFDGTPDPESMAGLAAGCAALVAEFGSAAGVWRDRSLPRIRTIYEWLRSGEPATLAELAEAQNEAFHHTMIPAYIGGNDMDLLVKACQPVHAEDATLVAYELTQGYESETLSANQELWELAQTARRSDALVSALAAADTPAAMADLRASGAEPEFFAAVDRFLAEHGARAEAWDIGSPTWSEQGAGFWALVGRMAGDGAVEPRRALAEAAARRDALAEETVARLAGDDEAVGRFQRRLDRIRPYVSVREDRAKWQLMLIGALRGAVLRRGVNLVEQGLLDQPDDVLFLLPDEVERPDGDLRALAAERRTEHERWRRVVPPPVIGGVQPDAAPAPAPAPSAGSLVQGEGASRGVVTGCARVVCDLDAADALEPGDVLVCVMTSPPWTPLFSIASAVVTDAGTRGSHTAIAAREYGIPAVVATNVATSVIPDGALVRVDGTAGTVELVG